MAKTTKATTNGSWSDSPGRQSLNAEHLSKMEEGAAAATGGVICLPKLNIQTVAFTVKGTSPLIVHRFSEKARKMILNKQMGKASAGREKKDPQEDYRESLYLLPDGRPGFPAIGFKCAMVTACTSLGKSITKVMARQAFHVVGELLKVEGEHRMREDMVRLGGTTADVRFRAEFPEWSCEVPVRFNANVLTTEQLANLLNTAGFAVGVGEWRPERDGQYGTFMVV